MKGMIVFAAASLLASAATAQVERNAPRSAGTVNSYSAGEEQRARAAAQRQGYTPIGNAWAQAGTIFMYAAKEGGRHQLTITPEGVVHATPPVPRTHPAYNF